MSNNLPKKILVIDDDQMVLNHVDQALRPYGVKTDKAKNLESALYLFNSQRFDSVIIEMEFEELPGSVIAQKFRDSEFEGKRNTPIVISTGIQGSASEQALITELEDITLLTKPVKTPSLLSALNKCLVTGANRASLQEILRKIVKPLQSQGKHDKAISIAERKISPLGNRGKFETALVMEAAGEYQRGIQALVELSEIESNNMKYINAIARMYTALGDLSNAKFYYEQADKVAPDNMARLTEMAGLYLALKEPEKSLEKYSKILALNPEKPEMKFEVYQELFEGGFEEHARDLCKQTSTPIELIRHFNNKGVMLSKENEFEAAINEYQRARNLIPQSRELYRILYNMAIAHINLKTKNDVLTAHTLLLEVLKLKPDYEKAKAKYEITAKALGKKLSKPA